MADSRRFSAPSDGLDLQRLWRDTVTYTARGLLIGFAAVAGVLLYLVLRVEERAAPPPAVARLIIRKPRSTKSFTLKRQRLRPRALTKQVTALTPRLSLPSARRLAGPSVFGTVQTFDYAPDTDVQINLQSGPIELSAATIRGTKEPGKRIAMREELIDLNALDTGKYKGLIIQDPTDRRNVKGFVYLGTAWANDLEPTFDSAARAIPNLVDALNAQTGITAKVDAHLFLDSQELFRTPFVYVTAEEAFELTERELRNLGEYLRRIFRDALGAEGQLRPISNNHPIYHTFYDFDGPPVGTEMENPTFTEQRERDYLVFAQQTYYLEGVFLGDRLVGVYSDKGYVHMWARNFGNEPQLRFGINAVVFALTQEGSIAQQQIDFFSQRTQ